ncbi:site-specific integrase [Brevundimonas diminuta]|uniref:tyrosine-type recombinase/integrase n=1 Tax=Brevundimonas diminuta TaxID=293 RepID=UPI001A1E1562|nr:site-specific integrase [Brevundimonas diminuta]MBK1975398.1 site-specific integrase [Brevundimonas diminuta]
MSLIPAPLRGPACTDALGLPRYAATIWLDFLNAHQAVATREKHALAISQLYHDAELLSPPVDLDQALVAADLSAIQRVLSSALIGHQTRTAPEKRWALQRRFVFGVLNMINGTNPQNISQDLKRLQRSYSQLRAQPKVSTASQQIRSLPAIVLEDMFEILNPNSDKNPFRAPTNRWRNYAIALMLFQLGLRRSELLLLTPDSLQNEFDFRTGKQIFWVSVRTTEHEDLRVGSPQLKNHWESRDLPLSRALVAAIDSYIVQYRGDPPHGYLFSSQEGAPLSVQSLNDIFLKIKRSLSVQARKALATRANDQLSPHSLRHTAAVVRYQRFSAGGMEMEEIGRRIRPFMGWAPDSEMPFHYARAFFEPRYAKMWDESFDDTLAALRNGTWS